jgi:sulfopropanediol 3-dehydrogenase
LPTRTRLSARTTHALPTRKAARHKGGLWVGKFTKTVTYQKVAAEGTAEVVQAAGVISEGELMLGHAVTCRIREERVKQKSAAQR